MLSRRVRLELGPTAIRPTDRSDLEELLALRLGNREHTAPWEPMRDRGFWTRAGQALELDLDAQAWASGSAYAFAILDLQDGESLTGRVALANVVRGAWHNATLGYWVDVARGRRGHATRAVRLVLAFAFEHAGLHRVQPAVIPRNLRSTRVVEKAGFRREGCAERYLRINGVWEDHDIWAMTAEEWTGLGDG